MGAIGLWRVPEEEKQGKEKAEQVKGSCLGTQTDSDRLMLNIYIKIIRAVKVLFQMNFVQFSSSFDPKNGPLVQFIVQFFTIKIQVKEELSSVQVPKYQVNFMNLVL